MSRFDYKAPAELFTGRSARGVRPMRYHRFDTGAAALQFAIETLPREHLLAAVLKIDENRYRHDEIRRFYNASEYPLARKAVEKAETSQSASKKTKTSKRKDSPAPALAGAAAASDRS